MGGLPLAAAGGKARAAPLTDGLVHLPARTIAPPASISDAAKASLRRGADTPAVPTPPPSDRAAWRSYVAERDSALLRMTHDGDITLPGVEVETTTLGGVPVYVATLKNAAQKQTKPHLSIHGGGWTTMGGKIVRVLAQAQAQRYGGTVYAVDYRRPPDHPFPAPLDDCHAAYAELTRRYAPGEILVEGASAGANLAAALMLKARDAGLPSPAALLLESPIVDLSCGGDTLQTNEYIDTLLKTFRRNAQIAVYAGTADVRDPYLSPLFGDLRRGFPPTYLRSGTRDLFLSDTVRLHSALRKAGVDADLYIGEAMPHGGFGPRSPEEEDARQDALRWLGKHWG